jgi:hypothetical protein
MMDLDGLSVEDLQDALRSLAQSAEVREKRVIACSVRTPGNLLLIQTGYQHGGCNGGGEWVLLQKAQTGWAVVEVRWWRS